MSITDAAMLPTDLAYAVEITTNLAALRLLEAVTEGLVKAGDIDGALKVSSAAACWCVENHPGVFTSPRIEQALCQVNRQALSPPATRCPDGPVVHLMTRAFPTGGHTRLTWRWIEADQDHDHVVVIVDQGGQPVPDALVEAAAGNVVVIPAGPESESLAAVHHRLDGASRVVLNVAEHDTVALAAVADATRRPPTTMINQADHRFFLGSGFADALLNLRPSAATLSRSRRGVHPDRNLRFPIPVEEVDRSRSREEAKVALGIDADQPVLLTMASSRKFRNQPGRPGFCESVAEVLAIRSHTHLIAVGPGSEEPGWRDLAATFGDRVRVLGIQADPQPFLEAADIYLDPFPLSSGTSLLEATGFGAAPVALGNTGSMLGYDAFGAEPLRPDRAEAWIDQVVGLIDDPARCHAMGLEMAGRIRTVHGTSGLASRIADVYAAIEPGSTPGSPGASPVAVLLEPRCGPEDRELVELYLDCHPRGPVDPHLAQHLADRGLKIDGLPAVPLPEPSAQPFSIAVLLTHEEHLEPAVARTLELLAWQPALRVLLVDATGQMGPHVPEIDARLDVGWVNDPDQPRIEAWSSAARRVADGPVLFVTGESMPGPRLLAALQLADQWPDPLLFLDADTPTLSLDRCGAVRDHPEAGHDHTGGVSVTWS